MSEELKMAIVAVRRHGLEPFSKVTKAMPQSLVGRSYSRWVDRQARVTVEVAEKLRKAGAQIELSERQALVSFGGVEARSFLGFHQALVNWHSKAQKAMRPYNQLACRHRPFAPVESEKSKAPAAPRSPAADARGF